MPNSKFHIRIYPGESLDDQLIPSGKACKSYLRQPAVGSGAAFHQPGLQGRAFDRVGPGRLRPTERGHFSEELRLALAHGQRQS